MSFSLVCFWGLQMQPHLNIDAPTMEFLTPLHLAVLDGHGATCRLFLDHGADVNVKDRVGETPLHCAMMNDNLDIVERLLDAGAQPNAVDDLGRTPLFHAARDGYVTITRLLLARGADPRHAIDDGDTALHEAIRGGWADIVALLLDHGASVEAGGPKCLPPLLSAIHCPPHTDLNRAAIVRILLAHGAMVDRRNDQNETPLDAASFLHDAEAPHVCRHLLDAGADSRLVPRHGRRLPEVIAMLDQAQAEVDHARLLTYGIGVTPSAQGVGRSILSHVYNAPAHGPWAMALSLLGCQIKRRRNVVDRVQNT
jgi:ankyrin repeat protein